MPSFTRCLPHPFAAACFLLVATMAQAIRANEVPRYEVLKSGGSYLWKLGDDEIGRSDDLATAIQSAIGGGRREVHMRTGGQLARTIRMARQLTLHGHGNTFEKTHNGTGFYHDGPGGITVRDMTITGGTGWGIHTNRASNLNFGNLHIIGGGIGIRVASHPSRPYEKGRWVRNLKVVNCTFERCGGHGLETYGVEDFFIDNITAKECRECGVLVNKGRNGKVGIVRAWRCSVGGGYAGLRFANNCSDITVEKVISIECGRGFFTVSNCRNIIVKEVDIRNCSSHAILIQHSDGVVVRGGTYNGHGLVHYTSKNSAIHATHRDDHQPPEPAR
jgi:hypothetical protein